MEWLRKIHECEDEKALKYFLKDQKNFNLKFDKKTLNYYGNVVKYLILLKKLTEIIMRLLEMFLNF